MNAHLPADGCSNQSTTNRDTYGVRTMLIPTAVEDTGIPMLMTVGTQFAKYIVPEF